jgi:hypothetical protein
MGKTRLHPPVKIIIACTRISGSDLTPVHTALEEKLSAIECVSFTFDFSRFTNYYAEEMGSSLEKDFVVFTGLEEPEILPSLKRWTNEFEKKLSRKGKRIFNLDPGYICDARLVLATTKNYTHRLYLTEGIFGDVHLIYQNHSFREQSWTYPDYRQPAIIGFFNSIREAYMRQLGQLYGQNKI